MLDKEIRYQKYLLYLLKIILKFKGLNIFRHKFLYTAYADGTTFFLKDRKSIIELMNELNFPGLKLYKTKCKIASINVLNGVQVALSRMKCINLKGTVMLIKMIDMLTCFKSILEISHFNYL